MSCTLNEKIYEDTNKNYQINKTIKKNNRNKKLSTY